MKFLFFTVLLQCSRIGENHLLYIFSWHCEGDGFLISIRCIVIFPQDNLPLLWMLNHFHSFHHVSVTEATCRTRAPQHCRRQEEFAPASSVRKLRNRQKAQMQTRVMAILMHRLQFSRVCFICAQDWSNLHANKMHEQTAERDGNRFCKNNFTGNLQTFILLVSLRPKCVISVPLNGIKIIMFPKHAYKKELHF